ncbi:MAG: type II toxin-antitoxin system VapC family toxin [Deltaproteobacteria bacterium]|nr:type II toxin-antitoxin system VapC family toxin [Deltaproteobacteria bacterium]
MRTAVDSSILLDILVGDTNFADQAENSLRLASQSSALIVCECVIAEVRPVLSDSEMDAFLNDLEIQFVPSTRASAMLAGKMMQTYLSRRATAYARVIPDFIIGAHALLSAGRLLARDRGFYRDYFKGLQVISPT